MPAQWGVWVSGGVPRGTRTPCLDGEIALPAVLDRLSSRLDCPPVLADVERANLDEAIFMLAAERFHMCRLFDLNARAVPG